MEKITLTKIYRSWKDKNGNPLINRNNNEYERVAIKCKEHGDKYISGFGGKQNINWKEGNQIEIEIEESQEKDKNGNPYLNFKMPDKITQLEKRVSAIEQELLVLKKPSNVDDLDDSKEDIGDEVKDDDIPF